MFMIKNALSLKQIAARLEKCERNPSKWSCPEDFRCISDRVPVYASKARGIVIKQDNFLLSKPPKELCVPTRRIAHTDCIVQPMVARVSLRNSVKAIRERLPAGCSTDLHTGNVGWLNGNPVMFDW